VPTVNWFGLSRRAARCVACIDVGDGGRGAIACASLRGIVWILHDEMTGASYAISNSPHPSFGGTHPKSPA
jgi:hypothetical protein